jgi:hypothetical protein
MNQILVSLAAALLLAGCATGANDGDRASGGTPADADSGAAADAADGSEIRCMYRKGTGSRLAERDCRTEAEWERVRQAAEQRLRDGDSQQSGGGS